MDFASGKTGTKGIQAPARGWRKYGYVFCSRKGGDGYDAPCEARPRSSVEYSGAGGDCLLLPTKRDLVLEAPMSILMEVLFYVLV